MLNKYMVKKHDWGKVKAEGEVDYDALTSKEKTKIILDAIPPMMMPVIILGGVMTGFFTPTEAAAVACIYAFILSMFVYKEMTLKGFYECLVNATVSSATILLIMSAATPFGWILQSQNVSTLMGNWLTGLSSSIIVVYGVIIIILLVLGTFMETLAIVLLTTPVFLPIVTAMGVDPIAYGITMSLALIVGSITPPLAVTLFTAAKIVDIRVEDTIPQVFYVIGVVVVAVILSAVFPQMSTLLPALMG